MNIMMDSKSAVDTLGLPIIYRSTHIYIPTGQWCEQDTNLLVAGQVSTTNFSLGAGDVCRLISGAYVSAMLYDSLNIV